MHGRSRWPLFAVACLLVAAGCGSPTRPGSAPSPSPSAPYKGSALDIETHPFDAPTSENTITYDADLVSDPLPDPPPTPLIDEAQARARAAVNGPTIGPDARPTATSATLRMLSTITDTPAPSRPGWIVIWAHTHPFLSHAVDDDPIDPATIDCEDVVVVDATTGTSPGASQYCRTIKR